MISLFEKLEGKISLSVDGWCDLAMNHFVGITAHFEYKNEVCTIGLDFINTADLSGLGIFTAVKQTIEEFNISSKILCVTTDNGNFIFINLAHNNKTFIEQLQIYLNGKGVNFDIKVNWIRCLCHVINLFVKGKE